MVALMRESRAMNWPWPLPLLRAARNSTLKFAFPSLTHICSSSSSHSGGRIASLQLNETQVIINKKPMRIIQPGDVDEVLEMYISEDRLDGDPYWCRVWPSAIALAEEILNHPQTVKGLRVCELGAGLGGLAATISGAADVVLYDREPFALLCALLTIHANCPGVVTNLASVLQLCSSQVSLTLPCGIPNLPYETAMSACIKDPTSLLAESIVKGMSGSLEVRAELFDWTCSQNTFPFDVVLASDVLYDKMAIPFLTNVIPRLLRKGSKASLLLTDPVHRTPENREMFLNLLKSSTTSQLVVHQGDPVCSVSRRNPEMEGRLHDVELILMKTGNI
ncbi:hypothetical protein O6H91_10G077100 [Diphasiastrum complanatum]|uniref:Uncharacterized protein n=1 Tax=Diphasiastrum complanatum TaxID=34168 RepID=A0ACC2CIJ3_DIPCM|nr:hypothetical protein O6H91_10G077100 [Diphasiastrum complanatum]